MARDPQNLHGTALLSQCPQDAPQLPQPSVFALSLLRSYKGLTVGDQSKATSILLLSQLPRRLLSRHGLRLKRAVSGTAVSAHKHSWSPLFSTTTPAPPSVCSPDALDSRQRYTLIISTAFARCSRGISTKGSKTFWHLCLQLSLLVLSLTSLSATSLLLSPLAAPSIYHTGIELRRHACRRLSPVPPPAGLVLWVYF